ncbi:hypothetical protein ACJRO7_013607 [Eucalyptus globulus]|uniref:ADP-ribosyl cyclase/cyclic ADP-ribose hydrolase n=1 Tax=Eucalyptus globulus TaxID=34317 RepID=A0ABD3KXA9_EUCGL
MMECKRNNGRYMVVPVFYKVKPAHVRHQTGIFEERFRSGTRRFNEQVVEEWKQALGEVNSILGYESEGGRKIRLINEILETINGKLVEANLLTISLDREVKARLLDNFTSTWITRTTSGLEMMTFSDEFHNVDYKLDSQRRTHYGKRARNQIYITSHQYA